MTDVRRGAAVAYGFDDEPHDLKPVVLIHDGEGPANSESKYHRPAALPDTVHIGEFPSERQAELHALFMRASEHARTYTAPRPATMERSESV
jgi:hypothetical protein